MKSALKTLLRRLIALVLMIGPFAVPAEAETVQDRLWSAINAQDATSLRVAIDQGADPNQPNNEGRVPLYRALVLQNQMLVDTLLGMGANANANDHRGDPLIITAMSVGSGPATMALIDAGANPNARDTTGKSVLSYAVYLKQPEIIAALIAKGADVNAPSEAGDGGNSGAADLHGDQGGRPRSGAAADRRRRQRRTRSTGRARPRCTARCWCSPPNTLRPSSPPCCAPAPTPTRCGPTAARRCTTSSSAPTSWRRKRWRRSRPCSPSTART